ncbi:MAG: hypothetical protein QNK24_10705 [Desulfuromusa sp.]|nr:hypothetical protein [Desulfuromusa sp.]
MSSKAVIQQLIDKTGKENVITEAEDLMVLGYDATLGLYHLPDIVVYPTKTEAVQAAMQIARDEGPPITPPW